MKSIRTKRHFLVSAWVMSILALGACSSTGIVGQAENAPPASSALNRSLQEHYVALAKSELSEVDRTSARHYAAKALDASSGNAVGPDNIATRNALRAHKVEGVQAKDLAVARSHLVAALATPQATENPMLAAKAQSNFDCWLEQQQEGWQYDDIAACRKGFESAMKSIAAAKVAERPTKKPVEKTVYFKFDSDELVNSSQSEMDNIVHEVKLAKPKSVKIISYTDLSGTTEYNAKLAAMRGESLESKLKAAIGPEVIKVDARGAVDPIVETTAPNQLNRRAVIIME